MEYRKNFKKEKVIEVLNELLQYPDILIDAVENENTDWDGEALLDFAMESLNKANEASLNRLSKEFKPDNVRF